MNKKPDRQLRLKKLMEREIDQQGLTNVTGGTRTINSPSGSRYCAM